MLTFQKRYFGLAVLIFCIEVLIALFVKDRFIRPYLGDVLVVILLYCFLQSFFKVKVLIATLAVLIFAFSIELLQYFQVIVLLGLEKSKIAKTVIGTSFSWLDLLTYVVGLTIVLVVERYWHKKEIIVATKSSFSSIEQL
jgi:hypothetical protein